MSTPPRITELRSKVLAKLETCGDHWAQPLPALSPMAWHVGHSFFVEAYWLIDRALGRPSELLPWHALYFPERAPKAQRGAQVPKRQALLTFCERMAQRCNAAWAELAAQPRHGLAGDGYLHHFLTQHYAQHLEIMAMVAAAQTPPQFGSDDSDADSGGQPQPSPHPPGKPPGKRPGKPPPDASTVELPRSTLQLGRSACAAPYDNELGAHSVDVAAFAIASQPVSVQAWQCFMNDRGYHRESLWCEAGWTWRQQAHVDRPWQWHVPTQTDAARAVSGISWYEANAFARWVSLQGRAARLPHEHEWMVARGASVLRGLGQVWEWCANPLATYPGFRAFPYDGYTLPWCDGAHYVLKGHSPHTEAEIRRPAFRNFYTADSRHIFAGLRLAYSP